MWNRIPQRRYWFQRRSHYCWASWSADDQLIFCALATFLLQLSTHAFDMLTKLIVFLGNAGNCSTMLWTPFCTDEERELKLIFIMIMTITILICLLQLSSQAETCEGWSNLGDSLFLFYLHGIAPVPRLLTMINELLYALNPESHSFRWWWWWK